MYSLFQSSKQLLSFSVVCPTVMRATTASMSTTIPALTSSTRLLHPVYRKLNLSSRLFSTAKRTSDDTTHTSTKKSESKHEDVDDDIEADDADADADADADTEELSPEALARRARNRASKERKYQRAQKRAAKDFPPHPPKARTMIPEAIAHIDKPWTVPTLLLKQPFVTHQHPNKMQLITWNVQQIVDWEGQLKMTTETDEASGETKTINSGTGLVVWDAALHLLSFLTRAQVLNRPRAKRQQNEATKKDDKQTITLQESKYHWPIRMLDIGSGTGALSLGLEKLMNENPSCKKLEKLVLTDVNTTLQLLETNKKLNQSRAFVQSLDLSSINSLADAEKFLQSYGGWFNFILLSEPFDPFALSAEQTVQRVKNAIQYLAQASMNKMRDDWHTYKNQLIVLPHEVSKSSSQSLFSMPDFPHPTIDIWITFENRAMFSMRRDKETVQKEQIAQQVVSSDGDVNTEAVEAQYDSATATSQNKKRTRRSVAPQNPVKSIWSPGEDRNGYEFLMHHLVSPLLQQGFTVTRILADPLYTQFSDLTALKISLTSDPTSTSIFDFLSAGPDAAVDSFKLPAKFVDYLNGQSESSATTSSAATSSSNVSSTSSSSSSGSTNDSFATESPNKDIASSIDVESEFSIEPADPTEIDAGILGDTVAFALDSTTSIDIPS